MFARVGEIAIHEPLGRGGNGVVWRGTDLRTSHPVALKVVSGRANPRRVEREARAMARLDHPGIVRVFDYGRVSEAEARTLQVASEAPWIAMELASCDGRTLVGRLDGWARLRDLLLEVLGALAHAHARGLVHRDLKPANLLVLPDGRVKVADFGLAWDPLTDRDDAPTAGSPAYMAPEQVRGDWRSMGPWTDLYGLGGTAWALTTGAPPGRVAVEGVESLPTLQATLPVPAGFEDWLRALLRTDPDERPQRAADAARALRLLGDPGPDSPPLVTPRDTQAAAWPSTTLGDGGHGTTLTLDPSDPAPAPPPPHASGARVLAGGLGLYALREAPLVGRKGEQDRLWDLACEAVAEWSARLVVIHGAAGVGKTRLSASVGERAHESGLADVLVAAHGPSGGEGLVGAVRAWARVDGLDRDAVAERLARLVDAEPTESFVRTVAAVLTPRARGPMESERRFALRHFLLRAAERRPLVLRIEDAQWGREAVEVARGLLGATAPLLVVLTVRDEALDDEPELARRLWDLRADPRVTDLAVDALERADAERLVQELLGLDSGVAREVVERSGGVPLFAVQLVGDWVSRGILEPGERGLRVRRDAPVELPDDLHALWARRIDHLVQGGPATDIAALQLAAILGEEGDLAEWQDACVRFGLPAPSALLREASRRNLVLDHGRRFEFVHGMLAESLRRMAEESGRAADLHRACAGALESRGRLELAGRIGWHLCRAGDWRAALVPLALALRWTVDGGNVDGIGPLRERWEEAARRCALPEDDPAFAEHWMLVGRGRGMVGDLEGEGVYSARALEVAERCGSARALLVARIARSQWHNGQGRSNEALAGYLAAADQARALGLDELTASALAGAALAAQLASRDAQSKSLALEALDVLGRLPNTTYEVGIPYRELGIACTNLGELDEAEAWLRRMDAVGAEHGIGRFRATARAMLADVAKRRRRWEEAREHLQAYTDWFLQTQGNSSIYIELHFAILAADQECWAEAARRLEDAFAALDVTRQRPLFVAEARLLQARCAASLGDMARARHFLDVAIGLYRGVGITREGAAVYAEDIARLAARAEDADLASEARRFSAEQWRQLGHEARAAALEAGCP